MRFVVYGAGAVGGVIGAHLHLAGCTVTLVARGEHLAAIRANGLTLDAGDGRHRVDAPATDSAAEVEWTDDTVVLLAVKSHQAAVALADLRAHAPADVPVICATNGIATEVATPAGTDEVTAAVSADLRAAGIDSVERDDIMAMKRRKLVMNLGNGVDASFAEGDAADELAARAQAEGEQVLAAAGLSLVTAEEDRERRGSILQRRPDVERLGGSTWQSLTRATGDTEIDYLAGEIVLQGRLIGIPTPVNEAVVAATRSLARAGGPARSLDAADVLAVLA